MSSTSRLRTQPRLSVWTCLALGTLIAFVMIVPGAGSHPGSDEEAAEEHYGTGVSFHLQRNLDDASREYDAVLQLDPPREPTASEMALVERFAPRIFVTASEPFGLKDVAAVLHPTDRLIAYHLFWDDDIDFPDDNDPSDHEVMWVKPSTDGVTLEAYWTYFHGRILEAGQGALSEARRHGMRPRVNVQWGKHGTLPHGWEDQQIRPEAGETEEKFYTRPGVITLREYNDATFRRLSTVGRRAVDSPIARRLGWPATFKGNAEEFNRFDRLVEPLEHLRTRRLVLVSKWNNAVLNRHFLPYNFRPKTAWPHD